MGYVYPNGDIIDSFVKWQTGYSKYKWLNNTVIIGEGITTSDSTYFVRYYYLPTPKK